MDTLQKYLFWIVTGVVAAAALGGYFWVVPGTNMDNDDLFEECKQKNEEITKHADNASKIPNVHFCNDAERYKGKLAEARKEVEKLINEKKGINLKEFDEGDKPAPTERFQFIEWYESKRKAIQGEAEKQKVGFPARSKGAEKDVGDDGFLTESYKFTQSTIVDVKQKLLLTQEIYRALAGTRVTVWEPKFPETQAEQEPNVQETTAEKSAGATDLVSIQFVDPKQYRERRKLARAEALKLANAKAGGDKAEDEIEDPYVSHGVEIRFLANLAAVTKVIQALEGNEKFIGVVKRLDIQRCTDPEFVPFGERAGRTAGGGAKPPAGEADAAAKRPYNNRYEEPPVNVFVELEIMEFNLAKGDFKPVVAEAPKKTAADPKKKEGARTKRGRK